MIDSNDDLRFQITHNQSNNRWYCCELTASQQYLYGVFQWQVNGLMNHLDPNVVLGLFTYPPSAPDGTDEIDIEFSFWGDASSNGLGWTVWPNHNTNLKDVNRQDPVSPVATSTVRFTWSPGRVLYQYMSGYQDIKSTANMISTYTVSGPVVASTKQLLMMNFWIFKKYPAAPLQVTVHDFAYLPLSEFQEIIS